MNREITRSWPYVVQKVTILGRSGHSRPSRADNTPQPRCLTPDAFCDRLVRCLGLFQGGKILNAIPTRRLGDPKELEGLLLLMASENASSYMTGSVVTVDGGIMLSKL